MPVTVQMLRSLTDGEPIGRDTIDAYTQLVQLSVDHSKSVLLPSSFFQRLYNPTGMDRGKASRRLDFGAIQVATAGLGILKA